MNINDVNNPLIGGELSKGKGITETRATDRADKTTGRIRTQQESETQASQEVPAKQVRDTYESTDTRKLAAELTKIAESSETEPREEAVNRAKERIQTGYYNSPEFLDSLASTLIGAGVTSL